MFSKSSCSTPPSQEAQQMGSGFFQMTPQIVRSTISMQKPLPNTPSQSIHRKRWMNLPMTVVGKIRGRGRYPNGTFITQKFTEGDVKLRRSIFRKLKSLIQERYSLLEEWALLN
jgi:hypothetical protein